MITLRTFIVALCIGCLLGMLIYIAFKFVVMIAKVLAKEYVRVRLYWDIIIVIILSTIIALNFLI